MRLSIVLFQVFRFLLPPALIFTTYVYLYPALQGCGFPVAKRAEATCFLDQNQAKLASRGEQAPFRLLALGDPQLEGDTSLPDPRAPRLPSLVGLGARIQEAGWQAGPRSIWGAVLNVTTNDAPRLLQSYRKRLDLLGNDYYLAHIYRTIHWWTQPTHTAVLGDLLGSQWINDAEFKRRADRFWTRVFPSAERVPESIQAEETTEVVGGTKWQEWSKRLINIAGNHDIGYAGDIDEKRIGRFEDAFGRVNWATRFQLPSNQSRRSSNSFPGLAMQPPELRLVILNDMNLDGPAYKPALLEESNTLLSARLDEVAKQRPEDATVLLTHIPLSKADGVCIDREFFDYFPATQYGGIREQNHLSRPTSYRVLDAFRRDADHRARGIIINGHDHEGCDVYHYTQVDDDNDNEKWGAIRHGNAGQILDHEDVRGVREITVRSMMGSYGGNAGLLSGWFDAEEGAWKFEYSACMIGVQHIWWGTHVLDLVVIVLGLGSLVSLAIEVRAERESASWHDSGKAKMQ